MFKLTQRIDHLESSSIMEITAVAMQLKSGGKDVISLAVGEPDFPTPDLIIKAAYGAMQEGWTKYSQAAGIPKVREAIAAYVTHHNGFPVSAEEVLPTMGAKHALFLIMQGLIEKGINVAVPTPAWVSYKPMIEFVGGRYLAVPSKIENNFEPDVRDLDALHVENKIHGLVVNSPNNPTGVVYSEKCIRSIGEWAVQNKAWIISDEIYERVLFDGSKHLSFAKVSEFARANTITVSGFSKSHCMTGWRFGWIVADKNFIKKMAALQSQMNSHVTSFVQIAAITAAELDSQHLDNMTAKFDERRKFLMQFFDQYQNVVRYVKPSGAFYLFVDLEKILQRLKITDVEFCKKLLEEKYVAAVPASLFGYSAGGIRISFATSLEQLKIATERMRSFLE